MTEDAPADRKSRAPRFNYPDDAVEQEAALQSDPFVERFAASRDAFAADRYRPAYHFVSPESGLNDPNGLCFWQERWHLFYQGYPPEDPRVHWGMPSATTSSIGGTCPTPSIPIPRNAATLARRSSRTIA